jgi:hypothetical protein
LAEISAMSWRQWSVYRAIADQLLGIKDGDD